MKQTITSRIEGEVTTTNKEHVADLLAVAKKAGCSILNGLYVNITYIWLAWLTRGYGYVITILFFCSVMKFQMPFFVFWWCWHPQVVIVPGYGVAVSKAQYALAELVEMLSKILGLRVERQCLWVSYRALNKKWPKLYQTVGFHRCWICLHMFFF